MMQFQRTHVLIMRGAICAFMLGALPLQAQRLQDVASSDISSLKASGYALSTAPATPAVPAPREGAHKIPVLAWALSFAFPGVGQVYNGQWGKAIPMFIMAGGGLAAMVSTGCYSNTDYYGNTVCTNSEATVVVAGAVVFLADWIWSQIDAPIAAGSINRRNAASVQVAPKVVPLRPAVPPSMAGYAPGAARMDRATMGLSLATITF